MISVSELKRAIGIDAADITRNDDIRRVEAAAVAYIEGQTGRYFGTPIAHTEYLNGSSRASSLWLSGPAAGLVLYELSGSAWSVVAAGLYEVRGYEVRLLDGAWSDTSYRAEFTTGYSDPPDDVRQAVIAVAVAMWRAASGAGLRSETIGRYSYTLEPDALPAAAADLIARWRGPVVG